MLALETPFSKGGTVPTNLLDLSALEVVTVVLLLLFNNDSFSFLAVILATLFEGADAEPGAASRAFDAAEDVLLPLPILFGRLELFVVSEN